MDESVSSIIMFSDFLFSLLAVRTALPARNNAVLIAFCLWLCKRMKGYTANTTTMNIQTVDEETLLYIIHRRIYPDELSSCVMQLRPIDKNHS